MGKKANKSALEVALDSDCDALKAFDSYGKTAGQVDRMYTFEEASKLAAETSKANPRLIVGAAEKDGQFVIVTGKTRRSLYSYIRKGYQGYEYTGHLQKTFLPARYE